MVVACGGLGLLGQERPQAHQSDDLGGAVDVGGEALEVMLDLSEIRTHRREERRHEVQVDPGAARGPRKGVHDQVAARPGDHRRGGLFLELIEFVAPVHQTLLGPRCVDDLVGDADERVDVADVAADRGG